MSAPEAGYALDAVDALHCRYAPEPWPFAAAWAERIDRHWERCVAERPHLFDGTVLMQARGGLDWDAAGRRLFRAAYAPVAFRAFLAWRDFGHPLPGFRNAFGMAALQAADGAFLLGEMGAHTANAGRIYFPSGTPDLGDVSGEVVDLAGSIARELAEETGLDPATLAFGDGFTVVHDGLRACVMQRVRAPEDAARLAARVAAYLGRQSLPELKAIHVVRGVADLTPAMPPFVTAYLRQALTEPQPG